MELGAYNTRMGILFAFGAFLSWGVGDFLIQRSVRAVGNWITLFILTAFGTVVFLPFVYRDIPLLFSNPFELIILTAASIVLLGAAVFYIKAVHVGKLSVVEPVLASEMLITSALAGMIMHEVPTFLQWLFILLTFLGILFVSTASFKNLLDIKLESGVILAISAALGMGAANFLYGWGSRITNPLLMNWFSDALIAAATGLYLLGQNQLSKVPGIFNLHKRLAVSVSILDNAAWLLYFYSMTLIPIAIATSISESYIVLAALLGIRLNKERLEIHQLIGIALAVIGAIILSALI